MKCSGYILFCFVIQCLFSLPAFAQVRFRTVVPQHAMVPGESFQVQYILKNADKITDFSPPAFQGFRIVSGPNIYSGDQSSSYKNVVFTIAAIKEGILKIPGATCLVNGKIQKSNDVTIKILSPKESGESSYFLKPGEDPFKKIRENLFLKLIIDKQTCFIGEPLVATFKLYSRLQSRSNVIRNPGFYGFSVYDMIEVDDKMESEEKLNGHWFDVHTIREVQLYPLQAGTFTIDAMELENQVEFYRSTVNKKTEQEVTENMYGKDAGKDKRDANAEVYEMNIKSNRTVVTVKPLPAKNMRDTFAGAVGNLSISAFVEKDSLLKNEEGLLTVDINGAGNFQRVNAPVIDWPQNIEVFDPSVKDTFNKQQVPLKGQRDFKYIFVTDKPGYYTIPSIPFSFFDLKTKTYKTVSTKPISIFISSKSKKTKPAIAPLITPGSKDRSYLWFIGAGTLILATLIFLFLKNKRNTARSEEKDKIYAASNSPVSIEEILMPAGLIIDNDKIFHAELKLAIWNYFHDRLLYPDTQISKTQLANILVQKGIEQRLVNTLIEIIDQCEAGAYTNAEMNRGKNELFQTARQTLTDMDDSLIKQ
jgi:hypothetical protein